MKRPCCASGECACACVATRSRPAIGLPTYLAHACALVDLVLHPRRTARHAHSCVMDGAIHTLLRLQTTPTCVFLIAVVVAASMHPNCIHRGAAYEGKASLMKHLSYASACMLAPLAVFDLFRWWKERKAARGTPSPHLGQAQVKSKVARISYKSDASRQSLSVPASPPAMAGKGYSEGYSKSIWDVNTHDSSET